MNNFYDMLNIETQFDGILTHTIIIIKYKQDLCEK